MHLRVHGKLYDEPSGVPQDESCDQVPVDDVPQAADTPGGREENRGKGKHGYLFIILYSATWYQCYASNCESFEKICVSRFLMPKSVHCTVILLVVEERTEDRLRAGGI